MGSSTDLFDRLDVLVDPDAEPVDVDEVLADFLLGFIRSGEGTTGGGQGMRKTEPLHSAADYDNDGCCTRIEP